MASPSPARGCVAAAVGDSASGVAHDSKFVVASGRPAAVFGRATAVFSFTGDDDCPKPSQAPLVPGVEVAATAAEGGSFSQGGMSPPSWHRGSWRPLPPLAAARGGGALLSIHGRLFCLGGCDEATRTFFSDADELPVGAVGTVAGARGQSGRVTCLEKNEGREGLCTGPVICGESDDSDDGEWWATAPSGERWEPSAWFAMPRALHAHRAFALPRLDW